MLYNPKWSRAGNDCSVSFDGFQGWVESRNPSGRYNYKYKHECAVGRWLKATDHQMLVREVWMLPSQPLLSKLDEIAGAGTSTYGALAERLREHKRQAVIPF